MIVRFLLSLLPLVSFSNAGVTVYYTQGQTPLSATDTAAAAAYTGAAAYNPTTLTPPPLPNPLPNLNFGIALAQNPQGASIPQAGSFMGFSIEFSVTNQVLGKNSSIIQVPFLNLMGNLVERGGAVHIRVGGNTQEQAVLVDSTADGRILEKDKSHLSNVVTATPPLIFTQDVIYMMSNISSMLNVRWYMGIPFNDTNWRLGIVEAGQRILGDYLLGFQAGNEPDLYANHQKRPVGYSVDDYSNEWASLIAAMQADPNINMAKPFMIGPNIANQWTPEQVWDSGYIQRFNQQLYALAVERYPSDNCFANYGVGTQRFPQQLIADYLNHDAPKNLLQSYLNSGNVAQQNNKPFIMFETNTASCGGFVGISDSFTSALWGLDYSLQMAYSNFSGALFHIGGQNVFYNPFTSPPTNQSTFHQWTVGPIYYAALVVAEALGKSNQSQVLDLNANDGNIYTPAYAIYQNGVPQRVALFNYMDDLITGNAAYTATISGTGAANVKVKYLLAPSVSVKGNYTWAGQTFGGNFDSDGRLNGTLDIQTVACNPDCAIKVPAPGFALVFLTPQSLTDSGGSSDQAGDAKTFSTSVHTKTVHTATVAPDVLATSNGHSGMGSHGGSTSFDSAVGSGAVGGWAAIRFASVLAGVAAGAVGLLMMR